MTTSRPVIVIDDAIAHIDAAFGSLGEVRRVRGAQLERSHLRDAEALVVRSVTRVDAALVDDTPLRFVGTATAGFDHVDRSALRARDITFAHAPGCNARAVVEYVLTAALGFARLQGPVGIVGYGQIGRRLTTVLRRLDYDVLVCDPPLAERGDLTESFVDLDTMLERCRTLSMHVPRVEHGPHSTRHLLDAPRLQRLQPGALVLNTSRGNVVDNAALLRWLEDGRGTAVLDVWEDEPQLRTPLLGLEGLRLATPHIAGYTVEGKARGTAMIHRALSNHLGRAPSFSESAVPTSPAAPLPEAPPGATLRAAHPLDATDRATRGLADVDPPLRGAAFETLRRQYPLRRELSHHRPTRSASALWQALQGVV